MRERLRCGDGTRRWNGYLLRVNGYIAGIGDFPEYHRLYREEFGDVPRPARTTVQAGAFEPPILAETDAIARVRDVGA